MSQSDDNELESGLDLDLSGEQTEQEHLDSKKDEPELGGDPLEIADDPVFPNWEEVDYELDPDEESSSLLKLPAAATKTIDDSFKQSIKLNLKEDPSTLDWATGITEGIKTNAFDERFVDSLKEGTWSKDLDDGDSKVGAGEEILDHLSKTKVTGPDAIARANIYMGGGTYYTVPCWGTGIWYTMQPIAEKDLLELYRAINANKVELGAYTYGAIFSSVSGFTVEAIANFIVKNISSTTLQYNEMDDILEHISLNDFQAMVAYLNKSVYTNGINYETSCTADPENCTKVVKRKVDVSRLVRTKEEAVPAKLRTFMAKSRNKKNSITTKTIASYQNELTIKSSAVIELDLPDNRKIKVNLKIPSIADLIRGTHSWIDGIKQMVDESVVKPRNDEERNRFISETALASSLRQYSHYIESITFGDGVEVYGQETLEEILVAYTTDTDIRKKIVDGINTFIDDSAMTVVGIKEFQCPVCTPPEDMGKPGNILPLDQLEVFMKILGTKVTEIRSR